VRNSSISPQDATDLTDEPTVGQAIGGLTHNQDVRVVVIDADHIQLTRGKSLDLDARLIAPARRTRCNQATRF